jgi:hypothetical protein
MAALSVTFRSIGDIVKGQFGTAILVKRSDLSTNIASDRRLDRLILAFDAAKG